MTEQNEVGRAGNIIRLTPEELAGEHVDTLLKRQMSMRGEGGVSRGPKRWYYRNWFIFMVVGILAAALAWAIIEPHFDDTFYIQGEIEELDLRESMPETFMVADEVFEVPGGGRGWISIRDQKIWLIDGISDVGGKEGAPLSRLGVRKGNEIGIYVERYASGSIDEFNLGRYLVLSPKADPPAKAFMSLERQDARSTAASLLLFPLVAGLVGLFIGAADGLVCRALRRALLSGLIGFLVGFIGGFIATVLATLIYAPLNSLALHESQDCAGPLSVFGFVIQMIGRALAWGMAGVAMGLGQGIALKSKRLFAYGLMGGIIGGLLGGLFFDPIDLLLLGIEKPSAHVSRLVGLLLIGGTVGTMIGLVELLARDAWLRMVEGPLAGKEFLVFKDTMLLGSSPRSDIYLFSDNQVVAHHATLRSAGDECEVENHDDAHPVLINNRKITRSRIRHGDRITIGRTSFIFESRQG